MNTNWPSEYVIAFERYNDLRREADQERLARIAREGRPSSWAKAGAWLKALVESMPCAQPSADLAYCTVPFGV